MPPFDVDDTFLSGDAVELLVVFIAMMIAFGIMIALGYWWQR